MAERVLMLTWVDGRQVRVYPYTGPCDSLPPLRGPEWRRVVTERGTLLYVRRANCKTVEGSYATHD